MEDNAFDASIGEIIYKCVTVEAEEIERFQGNAGKHPKPQLSNGLWSMKLNPAIASPNVSS